MKKYIFSVLLSLLICNFSFAKISFSKLDLNKKDQLLFTVTNESAGIDKYSALFTVNILNGNGQTSPKMLSFYPEQMELLEKGRYLQIRNSYGYAKYDTERTSFTSSYTVQNLPENPLPLLPYKCSFDGTWYCFLEQTSLVSADLILKNASSGKSFTLCKNLKMSYETVPVKWSPEKNLLLYEKDDAVYFCNPQAAADGLEIDEKYRKIGRGSINSVEFAPSQFIAYIDDSLLYKINTKELYTLGLYSGILGQGSLVGRLPFRFNFKTDKFKCNKDVSAIMLVQNTKMFTYLKAHKDSKDYMDILYSRPYTESKASLIESYIFWDNNYNPIVWLQKLPYDSNKISSSVYRITNSATPVLQIEDCGKPFLSPDGNKVAFCAGEQMFVYNISNWECLCQLDGEKIVNAIWADSWNIYAGGQKSIQRWNILSNNSELIALSSVSDCFWTSSNQITAQNSTGNTYEYLSDINSWRKVSSVSGGSKTNQNGRYRVFTGNSVNYNYKNAIYIRTLGKNPSTQTLYKETSKKKNGRRAVALVFDALDNADGLAQILSTMRKYNIKGDFFINGEFIRRYPLETKQIVTNGYNCNSMFFSKSDLTQNDFVIDEDFIRRGLARNEDEFYACTGKELQLYWHAPGYKTNENIIRYGNNAGYTYIDQKTENLEDQEKNPYVLIAQYYTKAVKNKGGLVPVTVGFSNSNESDYLYSNLDLLICALIQGGFEFVSLNEL